MKTWFKRFILMCGGLIKICWWFFIRPKTDGALLLIYSDQNKKEILLVKKSYGKGIWSIPGGNRDNNESIETTAGRESREEVGITVNNLIKIGSFKEYEYFRDHTTHVFEAIAEDKKTQRDTVEISDAQWFDVNNLPKSRGKSIFEVLEIDRNS